MKKLTVGDAVPDFSAENISGAGITPTALKGKPYIMIFTRYIGCPICQMHTAQIRSMGPAARGAGGEVLVFYRSKPETLAKYFREFDHEFQVIGDPKAKVYRGFGAGGSLLGYLAPKTLIAAARAGKAGYKHGKFEAGELQMPADFVINARGKVSFVHYGRHGNDHASEEVLLEELKKAR
jgi:peroxiredoxin